MEQSFGQHVAIPAPSHRTDPVHPDQDETEIVALDGNGNLEHVHWRDGTGAVTRHDVKHVFLMTGQREYRVT